MNLSVNIICNETVTCDKANLFLADETPEDETDALVRQSPSMGYDSFSSGSPTKLEGDISPDSGSYTDHSAIDIAARLRADHDRFCRRIQVSRRSTLRVPGGRSASGGSYEGHRPTNPNYVFSPLSSPYEQSAVSLLGGVMGISVPTRMSNIFEEQEDPPTRRQRSLTSPRKRYDTEPCATRSKSNDVVVTAIVEEHQPRMSEKIG